MNKTYNAQDRIDMFEKYIHINECSDEGGWFGYLCPTGNATEDYMTAEAQGKIVNQCDSEEEVLQRLIQMACPDRD